MRRSRRSGQAEEARYEPPERLVDAESQSDGAAGEARAPRRTSYLEAPAAAEDVVVEGEFYIYGIIGILGQMLERRGTFYSLERSLV